jgi:uncharacterized membrane protein
MHCTYCGAQLADNKGFCSSCGKAVTTAVEGTAPQSASGTGSANAPGRNASSLQPNVAGLLSYLVGFISGIFFLVAEPYKHDAFVRFHALQSIFLSVVWIVVHFAIAMLMSFLPWTMWHLVATFSSLVSLALFCVALFLMYKAYSNERFKLPVIGDLAEKQA